MIFQGGGGMERIPCPPPPFSLDSHMMGFIKGVHRANIYITQRGPWTEINQNNMHDIASHHAEKKLITSMTETLFVQHSVVSVWSW